MLRYSVVTGDVLKARWQELFDAYSGNEWKAWIKAITGEDQIFISAHLESAININVLAQKGDVYRWHFDAVAYTLLLYLSDSDIEDGGALEFYPNVRQEMGKILDRGEKVIYVPKAGDAALMDGTSCYHVLPRSYVPTSESVFLWFFLAPRRIYGPRLWIAAFTREQHKDSIRCSAQDCILYLLLLVIS